MKDESRKPEELPWLKWFLGFSGGVAAGGLMYLGKSVREKIRERLGKSDARTQPMTRREFWKRTLLQTALLSSGRAADQTSTYAFLTEVFTRLEQITLLPEYRRLPPAVRSLLLPPYEFFEGQSHLRWLVRDYPKKPWKVPLDALATTAIGTAAAYGPARAFRRHALGHSLSSILSIVSYIAFLHNSRGTMDIRQAFEVKRVQRELQQLHEKVRNRNGGLR